MTNWEVVVGVTMGFMITIGLVSIMRVDRKQSNVQAFVVCDIVCATFAGFSSCFDLIVQLKYIIKIIILETNSAVAKHVLLTYIKANISNAQVSKYK